MALEQRLNLKLSQKLVMTQSLQQAIKLLQMSRLELVEAVQQELLDNPVLEESEGDDDGANAAEAETAVKELVADQAGEGADAQNEPSFEEALNQIDVDAYFQDYIGDYQPRYEPGTFDFSDQPPFENMVTRPETLHEHLARQLGLSDLTEEEQTIGEAIIGNINDDGYLIASFEELAELASASVDAVEKVWQIIREFEPRGVAARNLHECLEIQVAYSEWAGTEVEALLLEHFDLLARQKYKEIMAALQINVDQLKEFLEAIKTFEPKPGRQFARTPPHYINPDVYIYKINNEYEIQLNDEGSPRLRVSNRYMRMLDQLRRQDKEITDYIKEKFKSAMWLIKSLDQRNRTIYKVAESLVRHQRDFFDHGVEYMRPLVLREIADDIGMHESTVSRVVNNKFVHTPRGVFELKYFFRSAIKAAYGSDVSSLAVKEKIRKLVDEEPPNKPFSDAAIVKILQSEGIDIARRTVAKYREELNIASSSKRRQKL